MNDRTKAAVIGGLVPGVLSIIPLVGSCCMLWAIAGGALAVYMYLNKSTMPFQIADGAKLGALAGAIGAGVYLLISLPMMLLGGAMQISQQLEQAGGGGGLAAFGAGLGIFMVFIVAGIIVGFGALGGVIGTAIFGKNRPGGSTMPPPPPPTNYGGTQPPASGGYGGGGGTYGSGS